MSQITQKQFETSQGIVECQLARSNRKSLEIQIKDDGGVVVRAPQLMSIKKIHDFIDQKVNWITKHAQHNRLEHLRIKSKRFLDGHNFLFLGKEFPLIIKKDDVKRSRIAFDNVSWIITVPKDSSEQEIEKHAKHRLSMWYKKQAQELIASRVFYYAHIMKDEPAKIVVKSQKRRWGTCDAHHRVIYLNWQLILTPLFVLDYVVVHELAHLKHANHSKRFWARVAKFLPDYKQAHQWLKEYRWDVSYMS